VIEERSPRELLLESLALVREQVAFLAHRHRLGVEQQDELESYVRLRLIERDYAILRQFEGRSSLRTYLAVVVPRLFVDFCNREWGKWRSSAQAKRLGRNARLLEELLYRDGLALDEARRVLAERGVDLSERQAEELARALPPRMRSRPVWVAASDEVAEPLDPHPSAESSLLLRHAQATIARALAASFRRLQPQERLLLRHRFVDRLSVVAIARVQGGAARTLDRRLRQLLVQLRRDLIQAGIDPGDLGSLLAGMAESDLGFESLWQESPARPSTRADEPDVEEEGPV